MIRRMTAIASLTLFMCAQAQFGIAQEMEGEKVRFESCDGVTLRGVHYAGAGTKSPAVLLLHELGDDRGVKTWQPLASALAKKGYAVLAFDFRGHGSSTSVDAEMFWSVPYNKSMVRGFPDAEIAFSDFDSRYYPVLVNDIAAAKAYMDRRNDAATCNSSNLVVIGAQRGATLGALWVNSEFNRFEVLPPQFNFQPPQIQNTPESKKILAAIWYDIEAKLGKRTINLPNLVYGPGTAGKVPTVFLYGDDDAAGKKIALQCKEVLLAKAKLPFTGVAEIPNTGEGKGAAMLKSKQAASAIIDYLTNVRADLGNDWADHDTRKTQFVWRWQRGFVEANKLGSDSLNFNTYEAFLPTK